MIKAFKKAVIPVIAAMVLVIAPLDAAAVNVDLEKLVKEDSKSAVCLYEDTTNTYVYRHNEDKKMYPASTTKIMTAVVTIENVKDLNKKIKIGKEIDWTPAGSSVAWLQEGEVLTYNDLLYALMLPSGNDAATVLAVNVGKIINPNAGSIRGYYTSFVNQMNSTASKIGMENTHFVNPHGFHDPKHYTTCGSLAKLAAYADNYPVYEKVVKTLKYKIKTNKATHVWKNHNAVINKKGKFYYNLAKGDKTGFTESAGKCVVTSSVNENGDRFYAVVMKAPTTQMEFGTARTLLRYGNENTQIIHLKGAGRNLFWYMVKNRQSGNYALMRVTTKEEIDVCCDSTLTKDSFKMEFREDKNRFEKTGDERRLEYTAAQSDEDTPVGEVVLTVDGKDFKEIDAYAKGGLSFRTPADIVVIMVVLLAMFVAFIALVYEAVKARLKRREKKKMLKEEAAIEEKPETEETAELPEEMPAETEEIITEETEEDSAMEEAEENAESTADAETEAVPEETEEPSAEESEEPEEISEEEKVTEESEEETESDEEVKLKITVDEDTGIMTIGRVEEDN